jgi:hypothetical protein
MATWDPGCSVGSEAEVSRAVGIFAELFCARGWGRAESRMRVEQSGERSWSGAARPN